MFRTTRLLSLAITLGLFAGYATGDPPKTEPAKSGRAGDVGDYFQDGKLKEKLTLRIDHRADRAGRSWGSTTWELDPSGTWTRTEQDMNFGIRPPFAWVTRGELSPAQLAALAQHLATQRFNTLPDRVGRDPEPDRRMVGVTVEFGTRSTTLDTERGALTDGCPEAGNPKADEWARFVAVALELQDLFRESKTEPRPIGKAQDLFRESKREPKPAPKTGPLTMKLVAKKGTYVLDLSGMTPDEFRKLLNAIDPFGRCGKAAPAGPFVDLEIVITNTSDQPVTIMVGGDDAPLTFDLKGPGAVSVLTLLTTTELRISTAVTIPPGKSFTHPVTQLVSEPRGQNSWYWTEPGEYTLSARWTLGAPKQGESGPELGTEPIKLTVLAPASDYLKDGKLKERIEIQDGFVVGFAGTSYRYFAIEPDGSWSVGSGVEGPRNNRVETARGKLTTAQLVQLAEALARHDAAHLPNHGVPVFDGREVESGPQFEALEIHFGNRMAVLYAGAGKSTPEEDLAIRARYAGIANAVKGLCVESKAPIATDRNGGTDGLVRPIDLAGYTPAKADGNAIKPARITTADELAKAIPDTGVRDRIAKQIDFDKDDLLLFAWTGSNTDRLSVQIEQTATGPVALFTFVKGTGEDFPRPKCRLFAVAKNWRVVERQE